MTNQVKIFDMAKWAKIRGHKLVMYTSLYIDGPDDEEKHFAFKYIICPVVYELMVMS